MSEDDTVTFLSEEWDDEHARQLTCWDTARALPPATPATLPSTPGLGSNEPLLTQMDFRTLCAPLAPTQSLARLQILFATQIRVPPSIQISNDSSSPFRQPANTRQHRHCCDVKSLVHPSFLSHRRGSSRSRPRRTQQYESPRWLQNFPKPTEESLSRSRTLHLRDPRSRKGSCRAHGTVQLGQGLRTYVLQFLHADRLPLVSQRIRSECCRITSSRSLRRSCSKALAQRSQLQCWEAYLQYRERRSKSN